MSNNKRKKLDTYLDEVCSIFQDLRLNKRQRQIFPEHTNIMSTIEIKKMYMSLLRLLNINNSSNELIRDQMKSLSLRNNELLYAIS